MCVCVCACACVCVCVYVCVCVCVCVCAWVLGGIYEKFSINIVTSSYVLDIFTDTVTVCR